MLGGEALGVLDTQREHGRREELPMQESGGEHNWGQFALCSWNLALCHRMGGGGSSYKEQIRVKSLC